MKQSALRKKNQQEIKQTISVLSRYAVLTIVAVIMLYPMFWLIGASFKSNNDIFTSINLFPKSFDFSSYTEGWKTRTEYTFLTYFGNTFKIVIPKVVFSLVSSTLTAYGFARFDFPYKKFLFSLLMATMFLPQVVTRIPLYLLWRQLNLLDTYVPLVANTVFAQEAFFVFMLIQFMRSIPTELDEAAIIDGCNSFQVLTKVLLPSLKPALISCVIFQFVWSMNDFMGPLIYVSSVEKYPVAIALKMSIDNSSGIVQWNQIIAMSIISILPSLILFFSAQKYFVEGVSSSGIKG